MQLLRVLQLLQLLQPGNTAPTRTTASACSTATTRTTATTADTGDRVRISKYKRKTFDKGYTPNWTEEVFVVDEIQWTSPITYKIRDVNGEPIKGTFYREELQKTD